MINSKLLKSALLAALVVLPNVGAAQDEQFVKNMEAFLKEDANVEKVAQALERFVNVKRQEAMKERAEAEKKQLEDQLNNPVDVELGNSPSKGPEDAPITIVEFSDFECPYCSKANTTVNQLVADYPGKIKVVFKNLPLPFHANAKPAAIAALAAGKQGKFWEMHDKLFENQRNLSEETYIKAAKEIGIDVEKFKKDLKDSEIAKQVDEDAAYAKKMGVSGTPGFFVNGVQVKGARPAPYFKGIIDKLLEKAEKE